MYYIFLHVRHSREGNHYALKYKNTSQRIVHSKREKDKKNKRWERDLSARILEQHPHIYTYISCLKSNMLFLHFLAEKKEKDKKRLTFLFNPFSVLDKTCESSI
jgi:hypothetical protein